MVHLLVVAPGRPLRNSLRFALEAEGYDVTPVGSLSEVEQPASSFACTILDHHGLEGGAAEWRNLMHRFDPVVLLANTADHPMAPLSSRVLTKPFHGPALSDAVQQAIAEPRKP